MASVWAKALSGTDPGSKNVHVQVNGVVDGGGLDWQTLIAVKDFHASGLRLDAVSYALSDKLEVLLAWDKDVEGEEPHVFLPLNGRGRLDFDSVNGLQNTVGEGKTGNVLVYASPTAAVTRPLYFTLALDFSKQRS